MKKILFLFCFLFLTFIVGCKDNIYLEFVNEEKIVEIGTEFQIELNCSDDLINNLNYELSNEGIIEIEVNIIKTINVGEVEITVSSSDNKYSDTMIVKVLPIKLEEISLKGKNIMVLNNDSLNTQKLDLNFLPTFATQEFVYESSNGEILSVDNTGNVKALKVGIATITVYPTSYPDIQASIEIEVIEKDVNAPKISFENEENVLNFNIGDEINILDGVKAIDDIDGDITNKIITTSNINLYKEGTYNVTYTCKDSSGNEGKMERTYNIKYNSYVKFIGHAGCYYGIMNTEEAFINAGKRGYYAIECDLKQTSDGVFVLCHDNEFNGLSIASSTYDKLKDEVYTLTRGGVNYSSKICTLERYLEICKEYNMKAVIELKASNGITNTSQSRMQALMNEIEKNGMLNDVIFLGSQYNCLIWVKQNGYDYIPCQYLVSSLESDTYLERCNTYDLDISFNVDSTYSNSSEWILKYLENGHKVACYTFSQYSTLADLQKWIDLNLIDYFTCDVLCAKDCNLPEAKDFKEKNKYTVKFLNDDGTLIKEEKVVEGNNAILPNAPSKNGYKFVKWDKDTTNVKSDLEIMAVYEMETYKIYYHNYEILTEKTFASKDDFINEFYNDMFAWFSKNYENLKDISFDGTTYKIVKNSVTVTFKDVNDIKSTDIYDFEKTFSNYIYKPVTRENDTTKVTPVIDENYFLNSSEYINKWKNMDEYFLNACINGYPNYDRTYTPTASGKIQIMFRFHQWQKGTNIASFNTLPTYYEKEELNLGIVLPTTPESYTILDEVLLPTLNIESSEYKFVGWKNGDVIIDKISKGTYGDLHLYLYLEKK